MRLKLATKPCNSKDMIMAHLKGQIIEESSKFVGCFQSVIRKSQHHNKKAKKNTIVLSKKTQYFEKFPSTSNLNSQLKTLFFKIIDKNKPQLIGRPPTLGLENSSVGPECQHVNPSQVQLLSTILCSTHIIDKYSYPL